MSRRVVQGGRLTPQLRPEELFAPIAVIDISARAATDPDPAEYLLDRTKAAVIGVDWATLIVGVIPWEAGSGGACRVLARY